MVRDAEYSQVERVALAVVAVLGMVGVNGVFVYHALFRPDVMSAAMANPVSMAFMAEAGVLLAVLAYLLRKWGVLRLAWGWFVVLSLLGSMMFALPVVLLWPRPRTEPDPPIA
jgi:hypothetical protein